MFIFFSGLGSICDEFRTWASNLVLLFCLLILFESFESLCVSYLFCVYFVFNCYLSLNVMFVFVSFYVMSYLIVVINYVPYL